MVSLSSILSWAQFHSYHIFSLSVESPEVSVFLQWNFYKEQAIKFLGKLLIIRSLV